MLNGTQVVAGFFGGAGVFGFFFGSLGFVNGASTAWNHRIYHGHGRISLLQMVLCSSVGNFMHSKAGINIPAREVVECLHRSLEEAPQEERQHRPLRWCLARTWGCSQEDLNRLWWTLTERPKAWKAVCEGRQTQAED